MLSASLVSLSSSGTLYPRLSEYLGCVALQTDLLAVIPAQTEVLAV